MKRCKLFFLGALFAATLSPIIAFADHFRVSGIRFRGLQRVTPSTARHYLPIKTGQLFSTDRSADIIRSLYRSGFFSTISLSRDGNVLIVHVRERQTIASVKIEGNKLLTGTKLKPILKKMGIIVGKSYIPNKMNQLVQGLTQQYHQVGYKNVLVTLTTKKLARGRVALSVHVKEGAATRVHRIHFVGNHHYMRFMLRQKMSLSTHGLLSWLTGSDHYSSTKLHQDLEALKQFYHERGYMRFRIEDYSVTPGLKGVDITIKMYEGPRFRVGKISVSGETLHRETELQHLFTLKSGDQYSVKEIAMSQHKIADFFGKMGFAHPLVKPITVIDDQRKIIDVDFHVLKGPEVTVRRISFVGNSRTADIVLRREMRQLEGAMYSSTAVARSKQRLNLLGFFSDVQARSKAVPGHNDMVDLDFIVKERRTGKAQIQAGYDNNNGLLYGANVSEPNFMGSGNSVTLGFQNSQASQYYHISYYDPYITTTGISRNASVFYSKVTSHPKFNRDSSYNRDGVGFNINYGIPITEHSGLTLGASFERINIMDIQTTGDHRVVPSVRDFLLGNSTSDVYSADKIPNKSYNDTSLSAVWIYNGLNRAIFPTKGFYSSIGGVLSLPAISHGLSYYILNYSGKWFYPLGKGFVFKLHAGLGYGSGLGSGTKSRLPFFKNFYAGGIETMAGYEANSLGPYNTIADTAIGGNFQALFSASLIVPNGLSDKLRSALVFGAGNVFQMGRYQRDMDFKKDAAQPMSDSNRAIVNNETFALKNLRTSIGASLTWDSPMGMLTVGVAWPLNSKKNDQKQTFGFAFGGSF